MAAVAAGSGTAPVALRMKRTNPPPTQSQHRDLMTVIADSALSPWSRNITAQRRDTLTVRSMGGVAMAALRYGFARTAIRVARSFAPSLGTRSKMACVNGIGVTRDGRPCYALFQL